MPPASDLQEALQLGLSVVSELWNYKAKNWVTCITAADIDNDGDSEILAGSRDGRVRLLTAQGDCRWERKIGTKAWVGTVAAISARAARGPIRMFVGTRDGNVYALDKNGKTLSKDGKSYTFDKEGNALEREKDQAAFWHHSDQVIRHVSLDNPTHPGQIVIASEDRCIYGLDYRTGKRLWSYQTGGRVRALACCDLHGDGALKILAGSADKCLYVLDHKGTCLNSISMNEQIYTLFVSPADRNGQVEILLGTDAKNLVALTPQLTEKWRRTFDNRLLCLYVADIDNDGQHEILAGSEDQHLYILDRQGRRLWRHNMGHRIFSVYAADLDNDGQVEVLLGADDQRIHALRIRLIRDLDKKIRTHLPTSPLLFQTFSPHERSLLEDMLPDENRHKRPSEHRHLLQQGEHLLANGHYQQALLPLLRLAQQKVDLLWPKDKIRSVRALQFGDIVSDKKQEIIMGTSEGTVLAFTHSGRQLWSLHLGAAILHLQAGYLDHGKWEEIIVCAADHCLYVIDGVKGQVKRKIAMSDWMSSISVTAPENSAQAEIIIGSEDKKIALYNNDLTSPIKTIATPQGISIIRRWEGALSTGHTSRPDIIAGSIGDEVYCYTSEGVQLWRYRTKDSIRALAVYDIDDDGEAEIIIGSEDRNVHVVDSQGRLRWRYYTPHRILTVEAYDIDGDGKCEILAGCGNGILYVLNHEGDPLWTYAMNDRIRVIRACDIDEDGLVELAVATEDQLELLRVVNQSYVQHLLQRCWDMLLAQHASPRALIETLQKENDQLLLAFALRKYAELCIQQPEDMQLLLHSVKDFSLDVRLALIDAILPCYTISPVHARKLLAQLALDPAPEIRLALIASLDRLISYDWTTGFDYLERFSHNLDRFVRRTAMRKVIQFINASINSNNNDRVREDIFQLLRTSILDQESDWVAQEAARALAHFLDTYPHTLVAALYDCVVSGVALEYLQHICNCATSPVTRAVLTALIPLVSHDLNAQNVLLRVQQAVMALEDARFLSVGQDAWLLFDEQYRLLTFDTLDQIVSYQCHLTQEQFTPGNQHFPIVLRIFQRFDTITRMLAMYMRRTSLKDRMASLLDTLTAIEEMGRFIDREYATAPGEEPVQRLPDHHVFQLLLKKWHSLVTNELNGLRGKAELQVELSTQDTISEDIISLQLTMSNRGNSHAKNVKVTLLHSNDYIVSAPGSFETELLLAQHRTSAEFTIQPAIKTTLLLLSFEIAYEDAADGAFSAVKTHITELQLHLRMSPPAFQHISNPYSAGTPFHDHTMFFGRERETAFLRDNLTRPLAKTMIVLYGQRRSGKTSLLIHLAETSLLEPHIAVFIDLQSISHRLSISKFLHKTAHQLSLTLRKRGIAISIPSQENFERDPTFAFDLYLDEVEEYIRDQKIILMFDEFEILETQVDKGSLEPEIFEYLRSLMQHRRSLNIVLAGPHKIEQLASNYWSVFFNIALHYQLSKLSAQGARDLIVQPVRHQLHYDPDAVDKIRQLTGDQPYLIHMICRSLVDTCNEKRKSYVTLHDIHAVQREVMQTGQVHFHWLWELVTPAERILLAILVHSSKDEHRFLPLHDIEETYRHHHLPHKRDSLLAALKKLMEMDIVECEQDSTQDLAEKRYKLAIGLMRRWLRKEKPLEHILRYEREKL